MQAAEGVDRRLTGVQRASNARIAREGGCSRFRPCQAGRPASSSPRRLSNTSTQKARSWSCRPFPTSGEPSGESYAGKDLPSRKRGRGTNLLCRHIASDLIKMDIGSTYSYPNNKKNGSLVGYILNSSKMLTFNTPSTSDSSCYGMKYNIAMFVQVFRSQQDWSLIKYIKNSSIHFVAIWSTVRWEGLDDEEYTWEGAGVKPPGGRARHAEGAPSNSIACCVWEREH